MNIKSLCESKTFRALYGSNADYAKSRYERALAALGRDEADFFSVPGRTEIIGNHTDHNHGMVMAASVGLDIIAAVYPTDDRRFHRICHLRCSRRFWAFQFCRI